MALLRDIVFKRRPNLPTLIKLEREKLNLKAVQKVIVRFDPFRDDSVEIRKFTNVLYDKSTFISNPNCILRTEVLTDRSEQTVTFELTDGKKFIFKCANLKCLELYKLMNEHLTPLAPKEIEVTMKAPKLSSAAKKRR